MNQAFVDRYLPGTDAIGRVVTFGGERHHEIVGVAGDARYRDIEQAADPTFYVPLDQNDERWPFLSFIVWTDELATGAQSLGSVAATIRAAVREADAAQPIARLRTVDEILAAGLAPRRFNTLLVGIFALTALLLAAVGTYGVMSYAVTARTREMGVRAALGASPSDLRRMVLGQGLSLSGVAVALGLGIAWLVTRGMASMLFEVRPDDPWTLAGVALALSFVALAATWLPGPSRHAGGSDGSAERVRAQPIFLPSHVNGPPEAFSLSSLPAYFRLTFHTKSISLMIAPMAMRDSMTSSTEA